jgi:hypothetical protein
MTSRHRRAAVAALATASIGAAAVLQAACGSDDPSGDADASTADASLDGTVGDAGSKPDVVATDTGPRPVDPFCAALDRASACNDASTRSQACRDELIATCPYAPLFREELRAAYPGCLDKAACDASALLTCAAHSLDDAGVTAEQQRLGNDYCTACVDGGVCPPDFYTHELNGIVIHELTDPVVQKIHCDAGGTNCFLKWNGCIAEAVRQAKEETLPTVCKDGG